MGTFHLDPLTTRDIAPSVLDSFGRLRVMPSEFWASTTPEERGWFGHQYGAYLFPTVELVASLLALIDGRKAIEIGAGNGVLAEALGITATDSRQQEAPEYRAIYAATGQPTVRYGSNVVTIDAHAAVNRYQPEVVVASWVTHKWDPARPEAGGNEAGVREEWIIDNCAEYIFIGNEKVHQHKSIWQRLPHGIAYRSFIYSRAMNGTRDFLASWPGGKA